MPDDAETNLIGPSQVLPNEPRRRSLWTRIRASRFLFISIIVHVLFGIGAAVYVVQIYSPQRKLTFKGGPPSPNHSQRALEHKVQLAKKQSTMSAPPINKRILSARISKISLPDMPAMPKMDSAPAKMAGVGGAGFGMPSALSGAEGSSAGGGPISFSVCAKAAVAPSSAPSTI